jgi:hypothetical protein
MKKNAQDEILRLLADRTPNLVGDLIIHERLSDFSFDELSEALSMLVASQKIRREQDPQEKLGRPQNYYRIADDQSLPIRHTILIGDIKVPRILEVSGMRFTPENVNEAIERLAEYANSLEGQFSRSVAKERRRYLADLIGLFGVFASVIALVVAGLPKIATDPSLSFWGVFKMNIAQLLPVAIVLGLFVYVTKKLIEH